MGGSTHQRMMGGSTHQQSSCESWLSVLSHEDVAQNAQVTRYRVGVQPGIRRTRAKQDALICLDLGKSVGRKRKQMVSAVVPDIPSFVGESQDLTGSDVQQSEVPLRLCVTCAKEIPTKRLAARPFASQCVPCLGAAGDVKPIKRFDETVGEEIVSTFFTSNRRIEERIARLGSHVPSPRILADETDSPFIETKRPEQDMERRSETMPINWLLNQPEPTEEDAQGE